jgi:hypothetical protein
MTIFLIAIIVILGVVTFVQDKRYRDLDRLVQRYRKCYDAEMATTKEQARTISKLRDTVGELNRDKVAKARELDGLWGELEKARNNAPKCEQRAKKTQGNGKAGAAKNGAAKRKAAHAE